jgi:hypothetical protein
MLTFSDWEKLTQSSRLEKISELLISSRYDNKNVYRPIKIVPDIFHDYTKYILQNYPNGEHICFSIKEITYDNYTFLYNWITGACMDCLNYSLVWDQDDFAVLYYCRYCGVKKQMCSFS